jgi:predicted DNA-binding transcriptional regulator AlpA
MSSTTQTDPTVSNSALLDVRTVAALLSISPRSVRRFSDCGKLPRPVRIGSRTLWRRIDLETWLEHCAPDLSNARGGGRR